MAAAHKDCVAAGSTDDIVHLLTDQSDGRVVILDTSDGTAPAEAAEKIMRAWPVPDGANPGSKTYCQYGIIYAVPSGKILCEPLARDGKHSLQEVVSGSDDLAAAYEWVCSLPKVVVHPPEPACPHAPKDGPKEHLWGADWRVVGGVVGDRPGVFGTCSGPGLRIDEHCTRPGCHATRTRDTHTVDEGHDASKDHYLCISYGELQQDEREAHDTVYGNVQMKCKNCGHDEGDHANETEVANGEPPCGALVMTDDDWGGGLRGAYPCPCKGWEAS